MNTVDAILEAGQTAIAAARDLRPGARFGRGWRQPRCGLTGCANPRPSFARVETIELFIRPVIQDAAGIESHLFRPCLSGFWRGIETGRA